MPTPEPPDRPDPPARPEPRSSIAKIIAEAWHCNSSVNLGREETSFLAGIYAYLLDAPEPSIDEETLRRIFSPVYELAQCGTDSETQRATMIIGRLKGQGILLRADYGGLSSDGDFALSPLGSALGKSMERERDLTKHNLSFMLMHMRAVLVDVLRDAATADSEQDWEQHVVYPLRDIIVELIRMVEQRQRGLDAAHKALRKEITELVDTEWTDAIDRCMEMIRRVDRTLRELNEVLSEHVEHLDTQLFDLGVYAGKRPGLSPLLDRTRIQLHRLNAWSTRRYEDWHGYYRNVQVYIRDVVQTDPDNLLRSRLVGQIRDFQSRPYGLVNVAPEPFLHLRDVFRPPNATPLIVPDDVLSNPAVTESAIQQPDRIAVAVEALLQRLHDERELDIVAAVRELGMDFSDEELFQLLMQATPLLLVHGITLEQILEQPWVELSEHLHAQTLELHLQSFRHIAQPDPGAAGPSPAAEGSSE